MSVKKMLALGLFVTMAGLQAEVLAETDAAVTADDIRARLSSPYHEGLLLRTYTSLLDRVQPDGYFPESLTGAYPGMFLRTTGALGRLFLQTGQEKKLERILDYALYATAENKMVRIPHVIGPRDKAGRIPIISEMDQIDGQAHVILAWGMLARARGSTLFEDRTYPLVADLMDRTVTFPYMFPYHQSHYPGLVHNFCLEHSRRGLYWNCFDFLTQSFVAAALENMIPVAQRREDKRRVQNWTAALERINERIEDRFTREFDGETIFLEMLLFSGVDAIPFDGLGWINLAAIPAGWQSVNQEIFRNTIDAWQRVAAIPWDGPRMTSSDWLPPTQTDAFFKNHQSNQVIGKALGWEMLYCMDTGQYDRVCDMLDFIKQVNEPQLIAEAFNYNIHGDGKWVLQDPGNGEQAAWWSWAMTVIRERVELPALPEPPATQPTPSAGSE